MPANQLFLGRARGERSFDFPKFQNVPLGQTHSLTSSEQHCFARFWKVETDGRTACAKTMIPTGRDSGLAEWIKGSFDFPKFQNVPKQLKMEIRTPKKFFSNVPTPIPNLLKADFEICSRFLATATALPLDINLNKTMIHSARSTVASSENCFHFVFFARFWRTDGRTDDMWKNNDPYRPWPWVGQVDQ